MRKSMSRLDKKKINAWLPPSYFSAPSTDSEATANRAFSPIHSYHTHNIYMGIRRERDANVMFFVVCKKGFRETMPNRHYRTAAEYARGIIKTRINRDMVLGLFIVPQLAMQLILARK